MYKFTMLPQAQDDTGAVSEDSTVSLEVLDNDLGGNSIGIYSVDQDDPTVATTEGDWMQLDSGARIKIVGETIVYDPSTLFDDIADGDVFYDTFTYTIRLGNGTLSTAEVTVAVTGVDDGGGGGDNLPPTVMDETIIVSVSTSAVIPAEWLLRNDDDPDGDNAALMVTSIDMGADSATEIANGWGFLDNGDGTFTVTSPGVTGSTLTLDYTVLDLNGGMATGTVTIELAAPSTSGDDTLDISARVYDFSFVEAKDGDDSVIGGLGEDVIYAGNVDGSDATDGIGNDVAGDAELVHVGAGGTFTGASDSIYGADAAQNSIWGETQAVFLDGDGAAAIFGDDVIKGGDGLGAFNDLYGDSQTVIVADLDGTGAAATITGGNDILISGAGASDVMRGDTNQLLGNTDNVTITGGADTFVFGVGNGQDEIVDFVIGEDKIEFRGFDASFDQDGDMDFDFDDLAFLWSGIAGLPFGRLTLHLDGTIDNLGDSIAFDSFDFAVGDAALFSASDFVFT